MIGWSKRRRLPEPVVHGDVLLEAFGVTVELSGKTVVDDVHVDARAGEVLALVGPNGAGKSTLLSALSGDAVPSKGSVEVRGRSVSAWSALELAMRRAVLPQAATLSFPFVVADVVAMGRAPWSGTPRDENDEAHIDEAMRRCEVEEFGPRSFQALSGGERARVALARVLAQDTDILMLDEPTAAMDLRHQELVLRLCREKASAGVAVIVVLHDLGLAAAYCDRVAILHHGRLEACGAPAAVFEADLLSRVYRQDVEVFPHPHTEDLIVLPRRDHGFKLG
ncbi:MAG TPA: heme ABC transporter ATP-binding protein [Candidatus Stackebrandtia excrementipullorum]|nr:heme ABC transporter ATP-binding protein [Candidatus Stackebrandtia excrementipullorum]